MVEQELHPGASNPGDRYDADGRLTGPEDVERRSARQSLVAHGMTPPEADQLIEQRDAEAATWDALRPGPGDGLRDRMAKARARANVGSSSYVVRRVYCAECGRPLDYTGPLADAPAEPVCPDGRHRTKGR